MQIDSKTGYKTFSILALPICNNEGDVIGVAQVINKKTGDFQFTDEDIEVNWYSDKLRNDSFAGGFATILNARVELFVVNHYYHMPFNLVKGNCLLWTM